MAQIKPRLPGEPGAYALVFKLEHETRIKPGRLGIFNLETGYYLYTGSALSGMAPRLARHLRRRKKHHWHIDGLTSVVRPHQVWGIATEIRMECDWAGMSLRDQETSTPVPGFGSSDCRCKSHLIRLESEASVERVWTCIATASPGTFRLDVPTRLTKRFLNTG